MNELILTRRDALAILSSLPLVFSGGITELTIKAQNLSAADAKRILKRLVLALGPWSSPDDTGATEFADRFVSSELVSGEFLSDPPLIQRLASRLFKVDGSFDELTLQSFPEQESELLLSLVQALYNLLDIRFMSSGNPAPGECQMDVLSHTKRPTQSRLGE